MSDEIELNIRTTKETKKTKITIDAKVVELRKNVSTMFAVSEERICLIFSGKILQNDDSLTQHNIREGVTLHLVIKNEAAAAPAASSSTTPASVNPTAIGGVRPGVAGLSSFLNNMNAGGAQPTNLAQFQAEAQRNLMQNPQLMSEMMQNPMVTNLLENPETMMNIIQADPNMRQMMENNPDMRNVLSNPSTLRQISEVARNPAMMEEMMRNYDRAVSNIEAIPGGFGHLERMYHDVQEPMMNAATGRSANPFGDLRSTTVTEQREGISEPMPNPWENPTAAPSEATTIPNQITAPGTTNTAVAPESLAFLSSPYAQNLMQSLSQNPELMRNALSAASSDPRFAGNSDLLRNSMPFMLNQMNNPEVCTALTNPRVITALSQIQQAMEVLRLEAPMLMANFYSNPLANTATEGAADAALSGGGATAAAGATPGSGISPEMVNMMAGLLGSMPTNGAANQQAPEERYASQLEQLHNMGFVNRQININALTATFGDVNAAIDRILSNLI